MIILDMAALHRSSLSGFLDVPGGRDVPMPVFAPESGANAKVKEAVKAFTQGGTSYLIITLLISFSLPLGFIFSGFSALLWFLFLFVPLLQPCL